MVGILLSGLSRISSGTARVIATAMRGRSNRSVSPVSWATTITLRTNGERDDQCSFMGFLFDLDAGGPDQGAPARGLGRQVLGELVGGGLEIRPVLPGRAVPEPRVAERL